MMFCSRNKVRCSSTAASADKILVDVDSETGICKMRLNGAPVNTLDGDMLDAAVKAIKNAQSAKEVKGIILTSNFNGKVFCSGLNIMDMYEKSYEHLVDYWTRVQEWYLSWYGCSKPTAAVINGHSPAGGCAWALMCDYRIMESGGGKTIGLNETKLGIVAPFFFVELMRSAIGHRPTELALLKGTLFDAENALSTGLVDDIDSLDNLMGKAEDELKSFTSIPPQAYHLTKFLLRQENINKLSEIRKEDAKLFADLISQPNVQQGLGMYVAALKSRKKE